MESVKERARVHAALGDPVRLATVDALALGDLGVEELREITGVEGNLLSHHLRVLESVGLVVRRASEGDGRRRYVSLRPDRMPEPVSGPSLLARSVLFICVHNSARSQYAAALWKQRTGHRGLSAGARPADRIHPEAVETASELGVDIGGGFPKGYGQIDLCPDLVVSVCDRARESGHRFDAPRLHWSVPDPAPGNDPTVFKSVFAEITRRVERLVRAAGAPTGPTIPRSRPDLQE